MSRILIVEDEPVIRSELRRLIARAGHEVSEAGSVEEAEQEHGLDSFDLVISDVRLPGALGTDLISRCAPTPVLIMTSFATVRSAVEAMKLGAVDYVAKPFDHDELLMQVDRILREGRLRRQNEALKREVDQQFPMHGLVGHSPAMREVFERVRKMAPSAATVLILGESGTGKELVARALHAQSTRANGPLVNVNCAAIPDSLIESELFGYEKGAFTGANAARTGLIESAEGGTVFLDEVGELPAQAQARLLRVLQEGEVRRVGANRARKVDVRVVAATHRDLPAMVQQGTFRQDLYYRLKVLEIRLPPLRERTEDLPELAAFLLERSCQKAHREKMAFSPEAVEAMRAYGWPGNVRELENAIERAVILADSDLLPAEALGLEPPPEPDSTVTIEGASVSSDSLEEYFKSFVIKHQGALGEAELARRLGVSRKTLWEKRQRLGLPRPK